MEDELSGRGSAWGPEICIAADMGWQVVWNLPSYIWPGSDLHVLVCMGPE